MKKDSGHEIIAFLVLFLSAFLWICLLSHDPGDVLGGTDITRNACGPAGSYLSFYLMAWIGVFGAFGIAALSSLVGLALLFRRKVAEWGWKAVGAVLFLLALSAFEASFHGNLVATDTLPGGYYGQFFHGLLFCRGCVFHIRSINPSWFTKSDFTDVDGSNY